MNNYSSINDLVMQHKLFLSYKEDREKQKALSFKEFISTLKENNVYKLVMVAKSINFKGKLSYYITSQFLRYSGYTIDTSISCTKFNQIRFDFTPLIAETFRNPMSFVTELKQFDQHYNLSSYLNTWYVNPAMTLEEYRVLKYNFPI